LRHSDDEDAIMFAFARSWTPDLQLHSDDIEGIQVCLHFLCTVIAKYNLQSNA